LSFCEAVNVWAKKNANLEARGAFDMRNLSSVALIVASFALSGIGSAVAGSMGNMGDPSAGMRYQQAICDAQRRGEYPPYHDACLPDYPDRSGIAPTPNTRGLRQAYP
jgi:hypothetical protein